MSSASPKLPPGVTVFERGWLSSNNILCVGPDGAALVDSGYATHAPQTLALVQSALGPRTLTMLVNTHLHSDHCGGNALLQNAYPSLVTSIPAGQVGLVKPWDAEALGYVATGQSCESFTHDNTIKHGDVVNLGGSDWEVHAAPGHDPHAVVLFQREHAVLISGDALWESGFGVVFPELEGESGFTDVEATLDMIESLRPRCVIPGHGKVFDNVGSALGVARKRLHGFMRDPQKHALHAAKVLLKFKLLELQSARLDALTKWAEQTPYFQTLRERYFNHMVLNEWVDDVVQQMAAAGALRIENGRVFNH